MVKDITPALMAFLLADDAIASMVGNDRIYPLRLPQGDRGPSIVYSRVSGLGDHHMKGPSGLTRPRFQIDAWAQTMDQAATLANLIKARLDGYRGVMTADGSPAEPIKVRGVFFDSEREDYDGAAEMFRVSRDYLVWYAER